MTALYIREQGAEIGRRGERLVITKNGKTTDEIPLARVDQLNLLGNVQLTTQAIATLLKHEIDVVFMSSRGKYRGRLNGIGSKNVQLRQQQLKQMGQPSFDLATALPIVQGKINNQRTILLRQTSRTAHEATRARGQPAFPANPQLFERGLRGMMQMKQLADRSRNLDALRGHEGKAAAYYFEAIQSLIDPSWAFTRRAYYPPPDPFNALLSFGYSLLLKDVYAAIQQVGLDPYLGILHAVYPGRPSLALDMMEEWRSVIVDAMALELVNNGELRPDSFTRTTNPKRPVELGHAGIKLVLTAYEKRVSTRHYHPLAGPGGQTTLRQAMTLQVRLLAQLIQKKRDVYDPFTIR